MRMLFNALLVGLAGFVGSIARYGLSSIVAATAPAGFPYGTLIVNVTGCALLGIVVTLLRDRAVPDAMRLAIGVGFIGAYTTFSAFIMEVHDLGKSQRVGTAILYVTVSLLLGLAAVWIGARIAGHLER